MRIRIARRELALTAILTLAPTITFFFVFSVITALLGEIIAAQT
jgi:hypothetical protein